jgi:transcriptional regulator GlxA family with amidase domain
VGIVLFGDIEVLDFAGPFEVFSVTRLNEEKRREEPSPFEVLLVAEDAGPVTTTGGMKVLPHHTFASCPHLDIVVCPGGWGTRKELKNAVMLDWMRDSFPSVTVEYGKHFVVDGRVFTSAGISAGIDMSLKVVQQYFGEGVARATARHMEYPYPESDERRIAIERK